MDKMYADNNNFLNNPTFLSGFNKSGTTLLLSLLDDHPQLVVIPEELHFFQNVMFSKSKSRAIKENTGFRMFLGDTYLKSWSKGKSWFKEGYPEFDKDAFDEKIDEITNYHKKHKDILLQLVLAFTQVDGAEIDKKRGWVSKTTQDEIFFPVVKKMFKKDAAYIYIVRDPRDVYVSYRKRSEISDKIGNLNVNHLMLFIVMWKMQVNMALTYHHRFENFHMIKFEDLVLDTKNMMKNISKSIKIDYSDNLLRPTRHGRPWGGNSVFSGEFRGLSDRPIGRYKKGLCDNEKMIIDKFLSYELKNLQYEDLSEMKNDHDNIRPNLIYHKYAVLFLKYVIRYKIRQNYALCRFLLEDLTPRPV